MSLQGRLGTVSDHVITEVPSVTSAHEVSRIQHAIITTVVDELSIALMYLRSASYLLIYTTHCIYNNNGYI